MKKIVVVAGLTGVGKTDIAVSIGKKFGGNLINADSRQIYKELDLGTNKGEYVLEEYQEENKLTLQNIRNYGIISQMPIHLFSFLSPNDRFSVYNFQQVAYETIDYVIEKKTLPIMVGGTGMYIDAVIKGYQLNNRSIDENILSNLNSKSIEELYSNLPDRIKYKLNSSDSRNKRRLINLNIKFTSKTTSKDSDSYGADKIENKPNYSVLMLYPYYDWNKLKVKLANRVESMFRKGFVDEVENLLTKYSPESPGLQVMGYSQVVRYLNSELSLDECKELMIREHIKYAKRQRTWFEGKGRGYKLVRVRSTEEAEKAVEEFLCH